MTNEKSGNKDNPAAIWILHRRRHKAKVNYCHFTNVAILIRDDMGTWGAGSFQNDAARDWMAGLRESEEVIRVRAALNCVVEHGGTKHYNPSIFGRLLGRRRRTDWLGVDVSQKALTAAEIVAAWRGHPGADLPDGTMDWLRKHSSSFQSDIVPLARQAIGIVKTDSELKYLWEEGDPAKWKNVVEDLERRLNLPSAAPA